MSYEPKCKRERDERAWEKCRWRFAPERERERESAKRDERESFVEAHPKRVLFLMKRENEEREASRSPVLCMWKERREIILFILFWVERWDERGHKVVFMILLWNESYYYIIIIILYVCLYERVPKIYVQTCSNCKERGQAYHAAKIWKSAQKEKNAPALL